MRTRTLVPVISTALVCAVVFGVLNVGAQNRPAEQTTPERCTPPKGSGIRTTIESNTDARVWMKETVRGNDVIRKFYACSNARPKHVYLASSKHDDLTDEGDTPAFSRVLVSEQSFDSQAAAFVKQTCPAGEDPKCAYTLRWVRLRDRKILREYNTVGPERPVGPVVFGDAELFWMVHRDNSAGSTCGATPCEVRMAGLLGDRTLDSGSEISGLTKYGSFVVFWIKDGKARGFDWGPTPHRMLD